MRIKKFKNFSGISLLMTFLFLILTSFLAAEVDPAITYSLKNGEVVDYGGGYYYYEFDIVAHSTTPTRYYTGQIFFTFNTEAFGENIVANNSLVLTKLDLVNGVYDPPGPAGEVSLYSADKGDRSANIFAVGSSWSSEANAYRNYDYATVLQEAAGYLHVGIAFLPGQENVDPGIDFDYDTPITQQNYFTTPGTTDYAHYAELNLSITNNPPEILPLDPVEFNEDETLFVSNESLLQYVTDRDDPKSTLSLSIELNNGEINLTPGEGGFVLGASENWNGEHDITLIVEDLEDSAEADLHVTVIPVDDPPVLDLPEGFSGTEDTPLDENLFTYVSDPDGPVGDNYYLTVEPQDLIDVQINGWDVTFTPAENWSGSQEITFYVNQYAVSERNPITADMVNVNFAPVNDAPYVINEISNFTVYEDSLDNSTVNVFDVFADVDTDPELNTNVTDHLVYSYSGNEMITIDINQETGIVTFTPQADWFGNETITITATDNSEQFASSEFTVTVENINDAPTIALPESFEFAEDGNLLKDFSIYVSDIDSEVLTLGVTGNTNVNAAINGLNVTFTATENWNGTEELTFTVYDNYERALAQDMVTVTVTPVNDVPYTAAPVVNFGFNEDTVNNETVNVFFTFADVDLDSNLNAEVTDELTYGYSGNEMIAIDINQETGAVTFTPQADWFGTETITLTATDNETEVASDEFEIEIINVNDAPEITLPETFEFAEDGSLLKDFSEYVSDIDSEVLTLGVTGSTNVNADINALNVTFTAAENWNGTEELTFTVYDNYDRALAQDMVTVIVTPVNDAPFVLNSVSDFVIYEDSLDNSVVNIFDVFDDHDLHEGFNHPVTDELTYGYSGNEMITIDINTETGAVTFTPAADWFGTETITLTATDSGTEVASDEFDVEIINVNDDPVIALPEFFEIAEDGSLVKGFGEYVSDIDSENLTLSVAGNTHVNASIEGLGVTFTATENWNGTEELTFTVYDNYDRALAQDNVNVIVTPVNDAPVVFAEVANFNFDEDTYNNTTVNVFDVFADVDLEETLNHPVTDELTYGYSGNEMITIDINQTTGFVNFVPAPDWYGEELITLTAADNGEGFISTQFTVTINNVNDAPFFTQEIPTSLTLSEDGSLDVDLTEYVDDVFDPELLTLTASEPTNLTITGLDGEDDFTFQVIPDENWNGQEPVTFYLNDGIERDSDSHVITFNVEGVNDAPYVLNEVENFGFDEDTVNNGQVNIFDIFADVDMDENLNDPVNDYLTYGVTGNTNITVDINTESGMVTFTPNQNWHGTNLITLHASDFATESASVDFEVEIYNTNDAPEIVLPESFEFAEDGSLLEDFSGYVSDIDMDELTLSVSGNTEIGVAINGYSVTFTASQDWNGSEDLTFTVSDNQDRAIAQDVVTVMVTPVNDAPVISMGDVYYIYEDVPVAIDYTQFVTDVDGDDLTVTFSGNTNVYIAVDGDSLRFSSLENWNGTEQITFYANDGHEDRAMVDHTITMNVYAVNDIPYTAAPVIDFGFDEDTVNNETVNVFSVFADVDLDESLNNPVNDALTYAYSGNTNITIDINNETGAVTFTPADDWYGTETITLTATDNETEVASDEFNVEVYNVNDAPTINLPATISFDEDTTTDEDFSQYVADIDLNQLTLSVTGNTEIDVNINGLTVDFSAPENWNGQEELTFTVSDNQDRAIAQDVVTVIVNSVNDAPVVSMGDNYFIYEDTPTAIDYTQFVTDVDGDDITVTYDGNTNVYIVVDGDSLRFSSLENWTGTEQITFYANDGHDDRATVDHTINMEVRPVNDLPTIDAPAQINMQEDTPLMVDFADYTDDVEGDAIILTAIGSSNIGVSINGLQVTLTSALNWNGTENISIAVTNEGETENNSASIPVVVAAVNDAPELVVTPDDIEADEDFTPITINLNTYFSDPEGDAITYSANFNDAHLSIDIDGAVATVSPVANWNGTTTVTVIADDGIDDATRATNSVDISAVIAAVNDAPVLNGVTPDSTEMSVEIDSTIPFSVDVTDIDTPNLTYNWYVNNIEQTTHTASFSFLFDSDDDFAIKAVVSDGEYDVQHIWDISVTATGTQVVSYVTELQQNTPNPFNPVTTIRYSLDKPGYVHMGIYNVKGQLIKTLEEGTRQAGRHEIIWDGTDANGKSMSSGIYLYKLQTPDYTKIRKATLLK